MLRHRTPRRVFAFEALETRNLMTAPAGVSLLSGGLLYIAPQHASGNVAEVSIVGPNVHVTVNGDSEDIAASSVTAIFYNGAFGGHDTFTNDTSILGIEYGWGSGNTFTGGTGYDYFYLYGPNQTIHSGGGEEVIYTHGYRATDTIDPADINYVM